MRSTGFISAIGLILFVAFACDTNTPQYQQETRGGATPLETSLSTREDIQPDPMWESLRHYGYRQKEEALEDYGDALDELNQKIKNLESRVELAGAEVSHDLKESWKEDTENLRRRRDKLEEEYSRLERATPENWENTLAAFNDEWNNLQDRWEGVRAE